MFRSGNELLLRLLQSEKFSKKRFYGQGAVRMDVSSYCLDNVRKYDYENFLAALLLPREAREAVFAIRAFNIAVAQIKDVTREEMIGRMRIQFWKETLDKIYCNEAPNEPIARALIRAKTKHNLSKKWLKNLIDSREENLRERSFSSVEEAEAYAEKSNSSIYYLTLQCLGVGNVTADHAASHIGKSEGIVKLIRGIPHLGAKNSVAIPVNLLALHQVSQEDILRGRRDQKVKDLVYDLASVAFQHLEHAKEMKGEVPKDAIVALLPAVSVSTFLRTLQRADFDIFHPRLQKRNHLLPATIWWAKVRNTYVT